MTSGVFRTRPLGSTPFPGGVAPVSMPVIDFPTAPEGAPKLLIIENAGLDVDALRTAIAGDVVVPGDANYDAARVAWNLAVDQRPAAVVFPETAGDVVAAVALRPRRGPARRRAGHRPQRRPARRRSTTRCSSRPSACAASTIDAEHARRPRRAPA